MLTRVGPCCAASVTFTVTLVSTRLPEGLPDRALPARRARAPDPRGSVPPCDGREMRTHRCGCRCARPSVCGLAARLCAHSSLWLLCLRGLLLLRYQRDHEGDRVATAAQGLRPATALPADLRRAQLFTDAIRASARPRHSRSSLPSQSLAHTPYSQRSNFFFLLQCGQTSRSRAEPRD